MGAVESTADVAAAEQGNEANVENTDGVGDSGSPRRYGAFVRCVCGDLAFTDQECPSCARPLCADCRRINAGCHMCRRGICRECVHYYWTKATTDSRLPVPFCAGCERLMLQTANVLLRFDPPECRLPTKKPPLPPLPSMLPPLAGLPKGAGHN